MSMRRAVVILGAMIVGGGAAVAQGQEFECLISPSQVVELGSPVVGVLESVAVERGDRVRTGQVIAQLQSGIERSAVELARIRAAFDQRRVARNQELDQDELISEHERDEMRTQSALSEIGLAEATERLEMRTIRSPINGVVVQRLHSPGELVQETAIVTLAQINPLNVEVVLPVGMLGRVVVGDITMIRPADPVGGEYPAEVVIVDSVVDAASGTFGVRLELPNPDAELPAGLQCRVRFADQ